jgi:alkanesulfonate monooxygenase SsuD/methylene tetrahydromethanopterin reductase-like flavin-dependent oxidoreductase (luciferase family)
MNAQYGRMKMCHMLADTDEELHAMADRIGVARKWWQAPPRHDSHYDIALSKKALAIAAGAVAITWRQAGAMNMRRRITGELGNPWTAAAWVAAHMAVRRAKLAEQNAQATALFDKPIGTA